MPCHSDSTGRAGDSSSARPFRLAECDSAASVVWQTTGFPELVVRVGVAIDLRPGELTPAPGTLARRIGVSVAVVQTAEIVWSLADEDVRFATIADAVQHLRRERGLR